MAKRQVKPRDSEKVHKLDWRPADGVEVNIDSRVNGFYVGYSSRGGFKIYAEGWFGPDGMTNAGVFAAAATQSATPPFASPEDVLRQMYERGGNRWGYSYEDFVAKVESDGWLADRPEKLTDVDVFWIAGGNPVYFEVVGEMGQRSIFDDDDRGLAIKGDAAKDVWARYEKDTFHRIMEEGLGAIPEIVLEPHLENIRYSYEFGPEEDPRAWLYFSREGDEISYRQWRKEQEEP